MGGTYKIKSSTFKGQQKNKEHVSEAMISKLLNDFNSASLLTSTRPATSNIHLSSNEEIAHSDYEEVVSSFKHLQLKRSSRKTKLKEKKALEQRVRAMNANNSLNEVIKAEKPIFWPRKLKNVSSSDSQIILPSRLSLSRHGNLQLATSSFVPSFHNSSSEEKTRIVDSLNKVDNTMFKYSKEAGDISKLSFSQICEKDSADRVVALEQNQKTFHRSKKGNGQNYCHYRSAKSHLQSYCPNKNNDSFDPTVFSSSKYLNRSSDNSLSEGSYFNLASGLEHGHRDQLPLFKDSIFPACVSKSDKNKTESRDEPSTSGFIPSPSQSPSGASFGAERSCSEEMRMEESNVNELAGYFEDLLHIPRKMSVMAEMMYA